MKRTNKYLTVPSGVTHSVPSRTFINVPSRTSGTSNTVAEALEPVAEGIEALEMLEATDKTIAKYCKELGIDTPF